jgi:hypothetical protein
MNPTSNDLPYTWGRTPSTYLAEREIVRLTILRSRLQDRHELRHRVFGLSRRHREALHPAAGDV